MDIDLKEFRVAKGDKVDLDRWPTVVKPLFASKEEYQQLLSAQVKELSALQSQLYAADSYALLLIFQGMDAAGKDGAIKHVMSGVNPQGCQVFSFKQPSTEELEHDFLWRTYVRTAGTRPHRHLQPLLLRGSAGGARAPGITAQRRRFGGNARREEPLGGALPFHGEHGKHLSRNGTRIVKFFLHISKDEQRKRFLSRIDAPDKNWKFSLADVQERSFWPQYMAAYQECLSATSSKDAPWYIIPGDDKENARLIMSWIILETLKELKLAYPRLNAERQQELQAMRHLLAG